MKTPTIRNSLCGTLSVLLIILAGTAVYSGQGSVVQIYKNATAPFDDANHVDGVLPLSDKAVAVKSRYLGGHFWTETRTDKIERFRCSQCHNDKDVQIPQAADIAHGDIVLVHGGPDKPLSCFTCHKKDERDFLETEAGAKIDMDHSYLLCGQCHFRQKKDWVGGAHGKRLTNWAGQRIVKNCASCHDPHIPRFEKRWPKTYSPPFRK